ncbi:MAG: LCP family protein [Vallitalea sp.]|nr:LCP family protein [Vallitalea sp.]
MNNNKKVSLLTKFLQVFLISVVIFSLIIGIATGGYFLLNKGKEKDITEVEKSPITDENNKKPQDTDPENTKKEKQLTTFAIFGVDKDGYRTDVTMVMTFNHITKDINIVSIPRDTKIELPTSIYNELKVNRKDTPKTLKINGVPAYSPKEKRNEYSVRVIEHFFDVHIDYYVNINLKTFRKVIDIFGPIEFDVPFPMYYPDPDQGLVINLKKGKQKINGARAEQLIRYRKGVKPNTGYPNGDIGRINMQHEFMKACMEELLTERNKLRILSIGTTILTNVQTNFDKMLEYSQFIDDISLDKFYMHNLPGTPKGEYFYFDSKESIELFAKISQTQKNNDITNTDINQSNNEPDEKPEPEKPEPISSKGMKIQILNSTKLGGFASRTQKKLINDGFNVVKIGDYRTEVYKKTKIIIPNEGMGEDLSHYFKDATIELKPDDLPEGIDIRIILGTDDKDK